MKLENLEQANKIAGQIKVLDDKIADVERMDFAQAKIPPLTISDGSGRSVWLTADDIGNVAQGTVQQIILDALYDKKRGLAEALEKL